MHGSSERFERLESFVRYLMRGYGTPAVSLSIVKTVR